MKTLYALLFLMMFAAQPLTAVPTNLAFGHEQIVSTAGSNTHIENSFLALSKGNDKGVAVWENYNTSTGLTEIWVRFFDANNNGWQGTPVQIATPPFIVSGFEATPVAALNDIGTGFIIYSINEPSGTVIVIDTVDANAKTITLGHSFQEPHLVNHFFPI